MKAIVQDAYGPPEVLKLGEIVRPEPEDEVLVLALMVGVDRRVAPYDVF
jgi:NADPH:quinone reductase-like Zn-dependent oxidoreductase